MFVVAVNDLYEMDIVRQALIAHSFLRLRGLKTDLIILNEEAESYEKPLQEQIIRLVNAFAYRGEVDKPGGVFVRSTEKIPDEDMNLILACARVVIVAARGSIIQQLVSPMRSTHYPPHILAKGKFKEETSKPLPFLELPYFNGVGGYSPDGKSYVIYLSPQLSTPHPWINVIANPHFGVMVSENGIGCTWYGNSQTNRLTPWSNDPVLDPISDAIYIRDEESLVYWTPTPGPIRELDAYRISHGIGYTRFEHNSHGIEQDLYVFVPIDDQGGVPLRIQKLKLTNGSPKIRRLTITSYSEIIMGANKEESEMFVWTEYDETSQALCAHNYYNPDYGNAFSFAVSIPPAKTYTGDRTEFIGRNSNTTAPHALKRKNLSKHVGAGLDPCMALQREIELKPGESKEVIFILGYAIDTESYKDLIAKINKEGAIEEWFANTLAWWDDQTSTIQVDVQDKATNFALNSWLPYQTLSCRFWGKTAFYQSSGALGFRDQLQDVMALLYMLPNLAREHILLCASRQFLEGDVQHWWHPKSGGGIRTRISDDLLWLTFVAAHYVRKTGDLSILEEKIPYLKGAILEEGEHEKYFIPEISEQTGSLLEHCQKAIEKGLTSGPNGIPLIGGGDWNDGMNRVGLEGTGESVWLGWFLIHVLNDFADLLNLIDRANEGEEYRKQGRIIVKAIEGKSWDGQWYHRAYFDDGTPIGSKNSQEATIDSISQSWAVISGGAKKDRAEMAVKSADSHLVQDGIVRLLTPPFDKIAKDPGYIKGYPPGVRENGGQYTHGSLWLPMAFARLGDGDRAVELLEMMHPHSLTKKTEEVFHYKNEPYVLSADVYDLQGHVGMGGWSWYTGSSGWMYRIWLEEILGFDLQGETLRFRPTLPKKWEKVSIRYKYKSSVYHIQLENPNHLNRGDLVVELDGQVIADGVIQLQDDGNEHQVKIVISQI